MARGVNKVILVGNVGSDPEMRYSQSGAAICNISLATSESWTDKQSGEKQERTEWHRVALFNRLGEIAGEYVSKGSQIYIEGSIRTDKYQDKQTGEDRYSTYIVARDMQLLGGAPQNAGQQQSAQQPAQQHRAPAGSARNPSTNPNQRPAQQNAPGVDMDDDIPF